MLKLENIAKSFGAVAALRGVSLALRPGAIHGLLGENGAGKSTLMNVLFGLQRPDAGRILIDGRPAEIGSPAAARRAGIGMVHQHFKLVPTLTVLENFALSLGGGIGVLRRRELARRLAAIAMSLGWTMDPARLVAALSVGQQQRLEIIKALAGGAAGAARVLILDEPTAVLTPQEFAELSRAMKAIAARGTAIVFISHKLAEVRAVCDELTVLRRGRCVFAGATGELTNAQLAEKMVGGPMEGLGAKKPAGAPGPAALELEGVCVREERREVLHAVSASVRGGEIVGIAGVDGNGQAPLVGAIVGMTAVSAGRVRIGGADAAGRSVRWRIDRMAYVPEDRQREALVMPLPVADNLLLKAYRKRDFAMRGGWLGWLRRAAWRKRAAELAARFDVRCGSLLDAVDTLSGGNQQKVVLARELSGELPVVLAVNPTRGLDVAATAFVLRQLLAARDRGAAVLLVHSDLDELLAVSDRVLVLYGGTLRDSGWPAASKEQIGRMMMGLEKDGGAPPRAGAA